MKNEPVSVTCTAAGKINLYLDVLSKEESGYHQIRSIMQSVSLCDAVTVTAAPAAETAISIFCDHAGVPTDEHNIAYKAAARFFACADITAKAEIHIEKHIPVAGGMAGGSTDGAAVLAALDRIFPGALTRKALFETAASLGADVPFCLAGGTMLCTGRGERLSPIENRARLLLLILPVNESVSTPWAYGALDAAYGDFRGREAENAARYAALECALAEGDTHTVCETMYNIFESVILPERPAAADAKAALLSVGACGAMMSGSGPTVFGVFETADARGSAAESLRARGYAPLAAETFLPKGEKNL